MKAVFKFSKHDGIYNILDKLLTYLPYLVFFIVILLLVLSKFNLCLDSVYLLSKVSSLFVKHDDVFSNFATVLTGIYFSIFALLLTINQASILYKTKYDIFKKIFKLVSVAFFSSIIYPFLAFFESFFNHNCWANSLLFSYFMFIFFKAIRIGAYLYLIIKFDSKQRFEYIDSQEKSRESINNMVTKIYHKLYK